MPCAGLYTYQCNGSYFACTGRNSSAPATFGLHILSALGFFDRATAFWGALEGLGS